MVWRSILFRNHGHAKRKRNADSPDAKSYKHPESAVRVAEIYRQRWSIEGLFQNLTVALACEIETLAYPRAALLGFALALGADNLLAVVRTAIRSVHGTEAEKQLSFYYRAEESAGTHRGMMVALPDPEWRIFGGTTAARLAECLREWAGQVQLRMFQKRPRGPEKKPPRRPSCGRYKHVATSKLVAGRKSNSRAP